MKIKAVRENQNYAEQGYLTFGKDYEVLNDKDGAFIIYDDDGDPIFILLTGSAHGFDFEVVQEEPEGLCPDPMPVVEPEDDLERDRIEDNLSWLEGLVSTEKTKIKSDGGSSAYYDFPQSWVTLNDMMDYKAEHQWGPLSFHMGNINKATYRFGEKDGTSKVYDINKIIYSGLRCKLMLEDKEAVRKYLQQLLDDPQFQENTK